MAIENVHYVFDHIRFYRSALRPVINDFLVTKTTTIRDKKKFQLKLARKLCHSCKDIFGQQKIYSIEPSPNIKKVLCTFSLMRRGKN